jgi:NAD-dependent SIR2 family protein deacetylase
MLGAGASNASAKTPIGSELVWNYYEDCSGLYREDDYGRPANDDLLAKKEEFLNYGRFLSIVDKYFSELGELKKWQKAMSEAMTYMPPTKTNGRKEYFVDEFLRILKTQDDQESISLIKRLILEHITKNAIGTNNKLYNKFIKSLPKNSFLITTNFDTLLTDKEVGVDLYFDCLIDFDVVNQGASEYYYKKGGQPILKLNGSLDWGICAKCNKLTLFEPHVSIRDYDSVLCNMTSNCKCKLEPYIVLPHQVYDQRIKNLWLRAEKELQEAACITIIGYSFPEYDEEIIGLFRNNANPVAHINVVDFYDKGVNQVISEQQYKNIIEKRMKKIFNRHDSFTIRVDGFSEYMKQS